jgi:hypothetical protein
MSRHCVSSLKVYTTGESWHEVLAFIIFALFSQPIYCCFLLSCIVVQDLRKNDRSFPGMKRLMKGRRDRAAFDYALKHIYKGVVGVRHYNRSVGVHGTKLADWLSCSDEAWFQLVMENYADAWEGGVAGGPDDEDTALSSLGTSVSGSVASGKWTGMSKGGNGLGQGTWLGFLCVNWCNNCLTCCAVFSCSRLVEGSEVTLQFVVCRCGDAARN